MLIAGSTTAAAATAADTGAATFHVIVGFAPGLLLAPVELSIAFGACEKNSVSIGEAVTTIDVCVHDSIDDLVHLSLTYQQHDPDHECNESTTLEIQRGSRAEFDSQCLPQFVAVD